MSRVSLFSGRTFAPVFTTAVLGAMNDNILRAAVIVLAAMTVPADEAARLALFAGAALSLPFVLFSGLGGALADKREKAGLIRWVKAGEFVVAMVAVAALLAGSVSMMLGCVFAMGVQSAFFGPLKQGWMPERLAREDLVGANAWMESGTFLAILAGTITGGAMMALWGAQAVAACMVVVAILGFAASWMLPKGVAADPELRLPRNPIAGNIALLRALGEDKAIRKATVLDCWFWAVGAVYLSMLPVVLKDRLVADDLLLTGVMALFAAGVGMGAFIANRLLKGAISVWPVGLAALSIAVVSMVLYVGLLWLPQGGGMQALVSTTGGVMVSLSVLAIAVGGGVFVVPLAAMVQSRARPEARSRTMAGMAVASALSTAVVTALVGGLVWAGLSASSLFLLVSLSAFVVAGVVWSFFPRETLQGFLRVALVAWFRVEVRGSEHLHTQGRVVFAPNHSSLVDGPLLFSLIGRRTAFAMTGKWADTPMMRRVGGFVTIASVDNNRPMAAKSLVRSIHEGQACVIFPEGRLTATGALMKVYPGTAWIIDQADAPVVPIHIEGLEFCRWSRSKSGYPRLLAPKVRVVVGAPRRLGVDGDLRGRVRREAAALALGDIMEEHRQGALDRHATLPQALADTAGTFGARRHAIADPMGTTLSYGKIALGADALARVLGRHMKPRARLGVLLPTSAGMAVVFTALWRMGIAPAMMNPTLGHGPALQALGVADVNTVLSSRAMVEQAKLEGMVAHFEAHGITMLWVEDIKASVTKGDKIRALWSSKFGAARKGLPCAGVGVLGREDAAVVLFTSGTEGAPKGVVLSHGNFLANVAQLRARTDVNAADRMLSALPLFHSFGLTGGLLLPLLVGAEVFAYPSPLHMKQIPEAAYFHQSTVIFGTDTFLAGWGRRANPYDFASVRVAIAGAEAVKPATRALWSERFGVRILEGYGATECAPVLALNTPILAKDGTVGRFLPGMEARLETVPGLSGQRLFVRGPNVMKGYLLADRPGELVAPEGGWYDTGDAVAMDERGFVTITGRIKRFAKIGGEMVSLAAVENLAGRAWPGAAVAAVALPDARKGNRVVLCVAQEQGITPTREALLAQARADGVGEIMVPATVLCVPTIPMLASGKVNYPSVLESVEALGSQQSAA